MFDLPSLHRSTLRAKYKAEDYLSNSYGREKKVSTTSSHDMDTDTPTSPSSPPRVSRDDSPPPALSPPPTMRSAKEEKQAKEDVRSFVAEADKALDSETIGEDMKGEEEKRSQVLWVDPHEEEGRKKLKDQASAVEMQEDLDNAEHKREAILHPDDKDTCKLYSQLR